MRIYIYACVTDMYDAGTKCLSLYAMTMHVWLYVRMYDCMYVWLYVCMTVCIRLYVCMTDVCICICKYDF